MSMDASAGEGVGQQPVIASDVGDRRLSAPSGGGVSHALSLFQSRKTYSHPKYGDIMREAKGDHAWLTRSTFRQD